MLSDEVKATLADGPVVLFGIEAHVCVEQTALDLLEHGTSVHVVADATSSRTWADREIALSRMAASGAIITTHEAVLFELLGDATHPNFREISKLIRTTLPISNTLSTFSRG
jgi:isochorismate hydrolase